MVILEVVSFVAKLAKMINIAADFIIDVANIMSPVAKKLF